LESEDIPKLPPVVPLMQEDVDKLLSEHTNYIDKLYPARKLRLENACVAGLDFKSRDLTDGKFINCDMRTVEFNGSQLVRTTFENCDLSGCNFDKCTFSSSTTFSDCTIDDTMFILGKYFGEWKETARELIVRGGHSREEVISALTPGRYGWSNLPVGEASRAKWAICGSDEISDAFLQDIKNFEFLWFANLIRRKDLE
jgi:hypothetical protein